MSLTKSMVPAGFAATGFAGVGFLSCAMAKLNRAIDKAAVMMNCLFIVGNVVGKISLKVRSNAE